MATNFLPEEDILRQKLVIMENAVSQLTFVKTLLRTNAEQARKEISRSVGHQLDLIRAREQTLLNLLETDVDSKEHILCDQMENINQAIGACQQALELAVSGNNSAMQSSIFRMNAMELRPRTNSHLIFKCDPSDMRRAVCNFGEVISDSTIHEPSDCLVFDNEHGDNGPQLIHKSVTNRPKWTPVEYNGFEFVRGRLDSTASSVEILADNNAAFEGNNGLPSNDVQGLKIVGMLPGLKRSSKCQFPSPPKTFPGLKEESEVVDEVSDVKRKKFEFETVIENIVKASVEDWLHKPKNTPTAPCTSKPSSSTETTNKTSKPNTDSNTNVKRVLNTLFTDMTLDDRAYMNKWLAKEVDTTNQGEFTNNTTPDWEKIIARQNGLCWLHQPAHQTENPPTNVTEPVN